MPLLKIVSSKSPADADSRQALLRRLSSTLARELQKPEAYVMTCLVPDASLTFAGTDAPACYVELKSIGSFSEQETARLSELLCRLLSEELGVAPDRIYVEFANPAGYLWGFDGETFA
jgi:phenylpyruvate tautomerase